MASTSVGVNAVRSPLPSVEKWMCNLPADAEEMKVEEEGEEEGMKQQVEEEEEEMKRDDAEETSTAVITSASRLSEPPLKLKVKPHGGDGGAEAEGSPPLPPPLPSMTRSPSRLGSSFFGRDRMVRAARAWREGARRAGLFLDQEEEEEKEEEEDDSRQVEHPEEEDPLTKNQEDDEKEDDGEKHPHAATELRRVDPRIPRLALARLAPKTRVSKLALAWMGLDRIEYIAINDAFIPDDDDGTVYYVLDVYHYQEQHSIPTHHRHAMRATPPPLHRQPDLRIQQRFSSFTRLRKNVLIAASCKHAEPCAYCDKMADFALTASPLSLGWRTKLFTTVEMRKVLLTQFITQLVVLARERRDACPLLDSLAASSNQQLHRHVTRTVPGLVKKFLTAQTGEHFMLR